MSPPFYLILEPIFSTQCCTRRLRPPPPNVSFDHFCAIRGEQKIFRYIVILRQYKRDKSAALSSCKKRLTNDEYRWIYEMKHALGQLDPILCCYSPESPSLNNYCIIIGFYYWTRDVINRLDTLLYFPPRRSACSHIFRFSVDNCLLGINEIRPVYA